jgi:hypothetical protein
MYKGNENVLKGTSLGKRENKTLSCFVFCFNFDVFRAARIYFCFSPGNEFCFSLFKIADLFLSVNVVASSLIKTHFVFGEFWFY